MALRAHDGEALEMHMQDRYESKTDEPTQEYRQGSLEGRVSITHMSFTDIESKCPTPGWLNRMGAYRRAIS
jgi:hypothetical protein